MVEKVWNNLPGLIRRLILAWLSAAAAGWMALPGPAKSLKGLEGLRQMSPIHMAVTAAVVFTGVSVLPGWTKKDTGKAERFGILTVFLILSLSAWSASYEDTGFTDTGFTDTGLAGLPFLCAVILMSVFLAVYAVYGQDRRPDGVKQKSNGLKDRTDCRRQNVKTDLSFPVLVVICFTLLLFGFISIWTVFRVKTYSAPAFDFGIFSQMFYKMMTCGRPETTLERDGLLSHFMVHVSPVYYLLLPFYCLYPKPVTLQVLQAAVLALAVVPAWKLTRRHGCTPAASMFLCLLLLLYPAFAGGGGYDLHENVFLAPFLLGLFYGIDCRNGWMTGLFAVLTLTVKEDAAVYVAVIGLWLFLRATSGCEKREWKLWQAAAATLLFAGAVVWFLAATGYLARYGDGVMTYRYDNFMYDGTSSLATVIKAAFLSPMKVLYECTDPEKINFTALTMLPLLGLPFMTRRYERLILLIPYILVNLMPDYRYQHDIFFQYTYGSTACLFYLTVVNYADLAGVFSQRISGGVRCRISGRISDRKASRVLNRISIRIKKSSFPIQLLLPFLPLIAAVSVSGALFAQTVVPKAISYPERWMKQRAYYMKMDEILQMISEDASVSSTTFYSVPLSQRDVLYDVRYSSAEHVFSTEYIVIDPADSSAYTEYGTAGEDGYKNFLNLLQKNGYVKMREQNATSAGSFPSVYVKAD